MYAINKNLKYAIFLLIILLFTHCNKSASIYQSEDPAAKIKVFNLGIKGNTAADLLGRINDVVNLHPDLVIIMIGTNDSKPGSLSVDSYDTNLALIISKIMSASSAVMLLTPPPLIADNTKKRQDLLSALRDQMDSIGKVNNSYFIDVNDIFLKEAIATALNSLYDSDGIHPNIDGYKLIANAVYAYLKAGNIKVARIVCFGDSITFGVGSSKSYPAILQDLLK